MNARFSSAAWPVFPLVLVPLCLLLGFGIVTAPLTTLGACLCLLLLFMLSRSPHPVLVLFLLILVFQDPIVVLLGGDQTHLGEAAKLLDEAFLLVLGLWCLFFSRRWRAVITHRPLALSIAGCYAGVVVSSVFHPAGWIPCLVDLALFSKPFLVLIIGMSVAPGDDLILASRNPIIIFMLAVVAFGLVFLLVPSLQEAYVGSLRDPDERLGMISAQGFFISPGTYSWFAAGAFGISYAAYLTYRRGAYLAGAITAAVFVVLSWRRRSIVAVFCMILLSVLLRSSRGTRARALAMTSLIVLVSATVFAPYAVGLWSHTVREYGGRDPLVNARVALYYTSVVIAKDHFPLGTGLASFGSHASKVYYSATYEEYGLESVWGLSPQFPQFITDTYWPMILGEGGVVSLVSLVAWLIILFRFSSSSARLSSQSAESSFLAFSALFLLAGSFVESTASHFYGSTLPATLGLLPAGMLIGRIFNEGAIAGSPSDATS